VFDHAVDFDTAFVGGNHEDRLPKVQTGMDWPRPLLALRLSSLSDWRTTGEIRTLGSQ